MPRQSEFERRIAAIDELVQRLETAADPATRAASQELVRALMEMHGAALERMLAVIGRNGAAGATIVDQLTRDELVASVLLLYDLHPVDLETRVRGALEKTPPVPQVARRQRRARRHRRDGRRPAPDAGQLPRLPLVGRHAQARHRAGDPRGRARRERDPRGRPGRARPSRRARARHSRVERPRPRGLGRVARRARARAAGRRAPRAGWSSKGSRCCSASLDESLYAYGAQLPGVRGGSRDRRRSRAACSPVPAAARPTTSSRPAARRTTPTCTSIPFPSSPATDAPRWRCHRRGWRPCRPDDGPAGPRAAAAASSSCGGSPRRGRRSSAAISAGWRSAPSTTICSTPPSGASPAPAGRARCCSARRPGTKYKRVPRDVTALDGLTISDAQWEALRLPIDLAFFYHSTPQARVVACYPSPAGATESLLELETWQELRRGASGAPRAAARRSGAAGEPGAPRRGAPRPAIWCRSTSASGWSASSACIGRDSPAGAAVWEEIDRFFADLGQRAPGRRGRRPMPDLSFQVEGAEVTPYAMVPLLTFRLRVTNALARRGHPQRRAPLPDPDRGHPAPLQPRRRSPTPGPVRRARALGPDAAGHALDPRERRGAAVQRRGRGRAARGLHLRLQRGGDEVLLRARVGRDPARLPVQRQRVLPGRRGRASGRADLLGPGSALPPAGEPPGAV